jgi:hypothetical protein
MRGDYPSADFVIAEHREVRRVAHTPTGIVIETARIPGKPIAVSLTFKIEADDCSAGVNPDEVAQAALRHLRVWLIHRYGIPQAARKSLAAQGRAWWRFRL